MFPVWCLWVRSSSLGCGTNHHWNEIIQKYWSTGDIHRAMCYTDMRMKRNQRQYSTITAASISMFVWHIVMYPMHADIYRPLSPGLSSNHSLLKYCWAFLALLQSLELCLHKRSPGEDSFAIVFHICNANYFLPCHISGMLPWKVPVCFCCSHALICRFYPGASALICLHFIQCSPHQAQSMRTRCDTRGGLVDFC